MKLSPLLREALNIDPILVKTMVEVRKDKLDYVLAELEGMGIKVNRKIISQPIPDGNYFIPAMIPSDKLEEVASIPGVVRISKSLIVSAQGVIIGKTSGLAHYFDEILGDLTVPEVEIPRTALFQSLPNPFSYVKAVGAAASVILGNNPVTNVKIFTTGYTYGIMKDVATKDGEGVTVAILDTGSPKFTYQFMPSVARLKEYTVLPEPPEDLMGHGSWCHNCVCGPEAPSIYGKIVGGAPKVAKSIHVKCLNTFPGTGTSEGVLKAIEIAVKGGARVISMSLGGPADGSAITDLQASVINRLAERGVIFVIAMGNSGPSFWTGGSPGISLKALTVGSASIMDGFKPAHWSSRGPGSSWDKDHQDEFEKLLKKYGDLVIKPDCTGLGGGRATKDAKPDEVIFSGESGWFEGFYDGIRETAGAMHGTSMATPHVAGIVACLLSDGVISHVDDVKKALRETANDYIVPDPINTEKDKEYIEEYGKSIATGWGLVKLSRFK